MKTIFYLLHKVISFIALLVFASGLVIATLGTFEFVHSFSYLGQFDDLPTIINKMAISLLKALDLFLFSIVFFVFSFGILMLFNRNDSILPNNLPPWLQIEDFTQLKVLLWEAVLTTLVVAYFAMFFTNNFAGLEPQLNSLILPGGILVIAISLFLLKKKPH